MKSKLGVVLTALAAVAVMTPSGLAQTNPGGAPENPIARRTQLEAQVRSENRRVNEQALLGSGMDSADVKASLDNDELLSKLAAWGEDHIANWGGIWVEQRPYRAMVGVLAPDVVKTQEAVQKAAAAIGLSIDIQVTPVKRSQSQLIRAASVVKRGLSPDEAVVFAPSKNRLELHVRDAQPASGKIPDRLSKILVGAGVEDSVIKYSQSLQPTSPGGWDARPGNGCTMAFPLLRPNGTRAILTAGHCGNGSPVWSGGATLAAASEERSWWVGPNDAFRPLDRQVHVDTNTSMRWGYLQIPGVTMADDPIVPVANTTVCRYGATTGATTTCSQITGYSIETNPVEPGVHVLARLATSCLGGDSGGPSWQGNRPVGIHVGSTNTAVIDPAGACFDGLMKDQIAGSGYFTQIGTGGANPNAIGTYHSYGPTRLLDTRTSGGPFLGTRTVSLFSLVNSRIDVSGVVLTITAVNSSADGWVYAQAVGDGPPQVSALNYRAGVAVSNTAIVRVGTGGGINIITNQAATDIVVDVVGYFSDSSGYEPVADGATFNSLTPARIVDSRFGIQRSGPICAGCTWNAQVIGQGGVPGGATFAVLNVASTGSTQSGYMTLYAAGVAQPPTANMTWGAGADVSRLVVVPIGNGGQISLFNGSAGTTDVVIDVTGYLSPANPNVVSGRTFLTAGRRLYDSRGVGTFAPNETRTINVRGSDALSGEGAPSWGVQSVLVNLTMVNPSQNSWFSVYPTGQPWPGTANVNSAGPTVGNLAWIPVSANGNIDITHGPGTGHLVVDLVAWSYQ